jgi:hypothetical protein
LVIDLNNFVKGYIKMLNLHMITVFSFAAIISQSNLAVADAGAAYSSDNNTITISSSMRPRTRSAAEIPNDAWSVDVSRSGDFCYQDRSNISLWRSNAEQMDKLQVSDGKGAQISLRWPSEQHELSWPQAKLPIESNSAYTLRLSKTSEVERQITMHQIPANLAPESEAFLAWMNQQGCHLQVAVLQK